MELCENLECLKKKTPKKQDKNLVTSFHRNTGLSWKYVFMYPPGVAHGSEFTLGIIIHLENIFCLMWLVLLIEYLTHVTLLTFRVQMVQWSE